MVGESQETVGAGAASGAAAGAGNNKTPTLEEFGTDLTKQAVEGKLDPVIGRSKEVERVTQASSIDPDTQSVRRFLQCCHHRQHVFPVAPLHGSYSRPSRTPCRFSVVAPRTTRASSASRVSESLPSPRAWLRRLPPTTSRRRSRASA